MALTDLPDWIDEHSRAPTVWFVKRLQANDTLATGSHQAGPYLPKEFLFAVFPALHDLTAANPRVEFDIYVDSQGDHRRVRAIWYNNELRKGTRNEARVTGFGGAASDLLDPESTGAIAILAFSLEDEPVPACHVWVCRDDVESDLVEAMIGDIDPSRPIIWVAAGTPDPDRFVLRHRKRVAGGRAAVAPDDEPPSTDGAVAHMPTTEALVRQSRTIQQLQGQSVDIRILRRHETMIDLFDRAEQAAYADRVRTGFPDIRSMLELADRLRRAREARGDDALALQMRDLLEEEGLVEGGQFEFRPAIDMPRPPDFVFPTLARYSNQDGNFRAASILFVEQAVRDRWQAIGAGADGRTLNILTVQRGVSEAQFRDMSDAGIALVVPTRLHDTYPTAIRGSLKSVESFLADVRHLAR